MEKVGKKIVDLVIEKDLAKTEEGNGIVIIWDQTVYEKIDKLIADTEAKQSLFTSLEVESKGKAVEYGRIPSGLKKGWVGIVFYFETRDCHNTKLHEEVVKPLISRLENENEDHGVEWRQTRIEAVVWEENVQITMVSFRVRDIY